MVRANIYDVHPECFTSETVVIKTYMTNYEHNFFGNVLSRYTFVALPQIVLQ